MKTTTKFTLIAAIALLAIAALNGTGCKKSSAPVPTPGNTTNAATQTRQYTCPMHPDVVQDKPGKCPKCGMELVEKH
jgi:hypothetical protein